MCNEIDRKNSCNQVVGHYAPKEDRSTNSGMIGRIQEDKMPDDVSEKGNLDTAREMADYISTMPLKTQNDALKLIYNTLLKRRREAIKEYEEEIILKNEKITELHKLIDALSGEIPIKSYEG